MSKRQWSVSRSKQRSAAARAAAAAVLLLAMSATGCAPDAYWLTPPTSDATTRPTGTQTVQDFVGAERPR